METIDIRPEKGERTIWFLILALFGIPILIGFVILMYTVHPLAFGLCSIGWLVFLLFFLWWIPAYFKSLEYTIGDEAVRGKRGVFWRKHVTVPYRKMTNVDITQGPVQRRFNIGTIHLQTAGAGGQQGTRAELVLVGIKDYNDLKDAIMVRVMGHAATMTEKPDHPIPTISGTDTLTQILDELKAIRNLLEQRRE